MFCHLNYQVDKEYLRTYFYDNYEKGKWTSFKIGWMFGFGYFISNLYWITNSVSYTHLTLPTILLV